MTTIKDVVARDRDWIMHRWYEQARRAASARGLDHPATMNAMPRYLAALGAGEDATASMENHLATRLRQGFQAGEIIDEFALLGRCIIERCYALPDTERPAAPEIDHLHGELQRASAAILDMFDAHMREDEQVEKRYLRLVRETAAQAIYEGPAALCEALREILGLVVEAMDARTAALVLRDREQRLLTVGAAGGAALEAYAADGEAAFAVRPAVHEEPTSIWDVSTIELEVTGALRASGVGSVLGIQLRARRQRAGVLYVGLAEARQFSAREKRRLEALAEQLVVHLDGAALFGELNQTIASLREERSLRELFVSVLAHDLRGPLSAAQLGSELMSSAGTPELAARVARNLDHMDRMIRDLLDANRIRAGESLPLRLESCDLGQLARDVVDELRMLCGDRFTIDADDAVRGMWSADELRRALWNLGQNAAKYGAPGGPIRIVVRRTEGWARITVHNEGAPISEDEQVHLFDAFSRTRAGIQTGSAGWGLGLALVRGCAEAHGGRVAVASTPAAGTTFTIEIPLDSRPHQRHIDESARASVVPY